MIPKRYSRLLGTLLVCITGTGCSAQPADEGAPSASKLTCRGEERDPWLAEWRERFLRGDLLAKSAIQRFGGPSSCEAEVTTTFEGAKFGRLEVVFKDGSTLTLETSPPETSQVALTLAKGFKTEEEGRSLLDQYVRSIGPKIDWSAPEERDKNGIRVLTYWAEDPGLNASASLRFDGNRLVEISLSMAL